MSEQDDRNPGDERPNDRPGQDNDGSTRSGDKGTEKQPEIIEGEVAAEDEPSSTGEKSPDDETIEAEIIDAEPVSVVLSATQRFIADRQLQFFRLLRNWVGMLGVVMFSTSFVTFLFFFLIELIAGEVHPYLGLFHFLVLPPVIILGLLMMGVGYWIETRKKRRALASGQIWAPLDIRSTRVRQRLMLTTGGMSAFMIFALAAGGYRAYEFTESTEFCGEVCHSVMHPEYTAYQGSPHARVSCVDCHVGEGASYYVQSKLSGLYQVYAVLRNIYPKPIPTPVHNLRPAQETCEQC
ncbi:MAG: NapC/NirT family cytochrome c, partial [Acidobacteriota bacterium]